MCGGSASPTCGVFSTELLQGLCSPQVACRLSPALGVHLRCQICCQHMSRNQLYRTAPVASKASLVVCFSTALLITVSTHWQLSRLMSQPEQTPLVASECKAAVPNMVLPNQPKAISAVGESHILVCDHIPVSNTSRPVCP